MTLFRGVESFGALYHDDAPLPCPTRPWVVDFSILKPPFEGMELGNIAEFEPAPDWSRWRLGDTSTEPEDCLNWIVFEEAGRRIFICDRMILVRVSWQDLFDAGFVNGCDVKIDGESYQCRLMRGGNDFRMGEDGFSGGKPMDNEWDRFVAGEEPIEGLPPLSDDDRSGSLNDSILHSPHNQFWNWLGAVSWVTTPYANRDTARCCRGYQAGQFFYLNTFDHRHEDIGWRPVLEQIL